jgi:hypothetical protein
VEQEWPKMRAGTQGDGLNSWAVAMFRTLETTEPKTASEQSAYDHWTDQRSDREQARNDRIHGAVGVIPRSLWVVLFFIAGVIFLYMLFFADRRERWFAQGMLMGSVVAVITATMLLIHFLDSPVRDHGGLQPVAMKRTLRVLEQERRLAGERTRLPCDASGTAR